MSSAVPLRGLRLPLSSAQQRLWFLHRLNPDDTVYNLGLAIEIAEPVNRPALARAVTELAARHDILRTIFPETQGEPGQVVTDVTPQLAVTELGALSTADRVHRIAAEKRRVIEQRFSLLDRPPVQATVIHSGGETAVLALVMHHIVADGWSLDLLATELRESYRTILAGVAGDRPRLPLQYAEYARTEQEWLHRGHHQDDIAYWKGKLAGELPLLELPFDRPRTPRLSSNGAVHPFHLTPELSARLRDVGRQSGTTLYTTLLSVFHLLLQRYSGQSDLVVGTPVANRPNVDLEQLVGLFVSTVVLRTDLSGDPTVRALLQRVQCEVLESVEHQAFPFDRVVELVRPDRSLAWSPLFQALFALQNTPVTQPYETLTTGAHFELSLHMWDGPSIRGDWEYNTDLFDAATIERLSRHFVTLAEAFADNIDRPISTIGLLSADERRQLVEGWNATRTTYPRDRTVISLFEEQARAAPHEIAIISPAMGAASADGAPAALASTDLTYGELNRRANTLAARLAAAGLGAGAYVGVMLDRSADFVIGVLATLKIGGVYVPLDPASPPVRTAQMTHDARITGIIAGGGGAVPFTAPDVPVVLVGDGPEPELTVSPPATPRATTPATPATVPPRFATDAACVMFTSGSTGRAKGIVVPHRAIVRLVRNTNYVHLSPGDVILACAPVSFDASTFEIWGALLNGGRLVLYPGAVPHPDDLARLIRQWGVTTLWLTAGLFHHVADADAGTFAGLRQLLAGGDALSSDHVRRALRALGGGTVINGYGPTENTTFTCCHAMTLYSPEEHPVPIGRPVANTRVYVLDPAMQPVPVGVRGELWTGGDGVALGYLNDPVLTSDRFRPDPFSDDPLARMYGTGDVVRRRADGVIEFVGRLDEQVKIRGFRIELGEVESVLTSHAGVETAVVIARGDAPGDRRLVAYVVPAPGEEPPPTALRAWVAERLPAYMVPAAYVVLAALPLNLNGKVDRGALPAPRDIGRSGAEAAFVEPATDTEKGIAAAWREVLRLDRVGVDDNFFEIGGHSLLATSVLSRIQRAFGAKLELRALFEAPTVRQLAGRLDVMVNSMREAGRHPTPGAAADGLVLRRVPRDRPAPLSSGQQRLWFLHRLSPLDTVYNMGMSVALAEPVDQAALERAVAQLADRHDTLRTRFPDVDGTPHQVVTDAPPRLDLVELGQHPPAERERRLAGEQERLVTRRFRLEEQPPFQATLVRTGGDRALVVLVMHHILADGWSLDLIASQLVELYQLARAGAKDSTPAPTPAPAWRYADYAASEQEWLRHANHDADIDYWKRKLSGELTLLDLPFDRPRTAELSSHGGSLSFVVPAALSTRLRSLSRGAGTTLFTTLLAVYEVLLHRYSGQADIIVGTPVANRPRVELEPLVGFFVSTVVLRTDLGGDPTVGALLQRVHDEVLTSLAHQDFPFDKVVELARPDRSLAHSPLFQTLFALQNTPAAGAYEQLGSGAQFELSLHMWESGDEIRGSWQYNADLFDAATIERMSRHFTALATAVADGPARRLSELSPFSAGELEQLTRQWNETAAPFPEQCFHELIDAQAALTPTAEAVRFDDRALTYRQLTERANRLAHRLRALGVGRGGLVGICLDRGLDTVLAPLAALKAGAAYVPLDPAYPRERLAFMARDAQLAAVITDDASAGALPPLACPVVSLDAHRAAIAGEPASAPIDPAAPRDLAYVLYTSGSTGQPKGVMVEHRALMNLLHAVRQRPGISATDCLLSLTTLAFDIAGVEIWLPLIAGARVHLASRFVAMDGHALGLAIDRSGATVVQATPTTWRNLVESGWRSGGRLKIISGGEALSRQLADALLDTGAEVWNGYGPTETTIYSTFHKVQRDGRVIPIGRPIANTTAFVLDPERRPLPLNVAGELYLGGAGLARGYLNRADLTAERFVPNPFDAGAASLLYRTGDQVRRRADGAIEYLGRLDHQVKLRGFRIELGEVESVLSMHDAVQAAAVMVREDTKGDPRLVAYVVGRPGAAPAPEMLRAWAAARLPSFMVPSSVVSLESFPLTPNGKVDRRALPPPGATSAGGASDPGRAAFEAPGTDTEARVAAIWRAVLRRDAIGIDESFFDAGGHSLLAASVLARVRKAFDVDLTLRAFFEAPTVRQFAERVDAIQSAREPSLPGATGKRGQFEL